jgi:DNA-binding response OmpR family regulator
MTPSISSSKKILLIEDDQDILFALASFLQAEGYAVQTALNGLEALELLQRESLPHLILLDMTMPIMNGWEFAAEFRTRYKNEVPIIVITAAADAKQRSIDIHAAGWIAKPFKLDVLLSTIKGQV